MKRTFLSITLLFSTALPLTAAHATASALAAKQDYCERLAVITTEDGTTEVWKCYDLGGGVY